ncbi:armadillo repeat-containing protein 2 isoform X2 [Thrips palmi]|nr:armadillo repeat-containing protein 2 isoform X2 [Thrips palmi]
MEKKSKSGKSKTHLAFYEPPACVKKTSSEIISEARAAITHSEVANTSKSSSTVIQPVNTKRPYTPRDGQRTLFGRSRGTSQRPPSSFSLRYLQCQDGDSGDASFSNSFPPKRTAQLQPMSTSSHTHSATLDMVKERHLTSEFGSIGDFGSTGDASFPLANAWTRLPSISKMVDAQELRRKRRHQFRASASLDNLPEELEGTDNPSKLHANETPVRNAYSSPKEHFERLSDCLDIADLQRESSAQLSSQTSKTPRKQMKHDNGLVNTMSPSPKNNSLSSSEKPPEPSMLSLDVGNLPSEMLRFQNVATTGQIAKKASMNSSEIEHNLFGPNITTGARDSYPLTEVDGGVFGENLHANVSKKFEPDKESAIYDNCINEAKLANVNKEMKYPEENLMTSKTQQIINKLTELAINGGADAVVMQNLDELYNALNGSVFQRKGDISSKLKTQVLKCVYRFVERSEDSLLLKLARVIFCLPVTGSNLAGVCKLVFKVARTDKNDYLFLEGNILDLFIDALGTASPLEDAEACVYGYGALKFLTMNNQLLSHILDLGTLDLMVLHLKIVNSVRSEGGRLPEQTSHAIFQLTGALRNIAGEETTFPMLVANGAVSQLCQSMELFSTDLDLVTNIARTFSIISTNDDCCKAIAKYRNCTKLFAKLFSKYPGRQDIVVRLGYALGNLLAKSDDIRLQLLETDGAMDTLMDLLQLYLQKDLDLASQDPQHHPQKEQSLPLESGSDGSIEDVIVKMIRIIANMSMNMEVGERLTCTPKALIKDGADLSIRNDSWGDHLNEKDSSIGDRAVSLLLTVLRRKSVAESAELVLSTLSTLNNLTFYPCGAEQSVFNVHIMDLSQALYTLLMSSLDECLVETTKVLGNLTRSKPARDFLLETGGLNQLLKFLQTDNHELLRSTTGVLVNLMADADKREALQHTQGISRLIALLVYHGESDWQLASLICQVLWNFCIDMTNLNWLGADHTSQLVEVLVDFLDDERLFGTRDFIAENNSNENALSGIYQQWEEFAVIATNLLEKIETYMDGIQQHSLPPDLSTGQHNSVISSSANQWEEIPANSGSIVPTPNIT